MQRGSIGCMPCAPCRRSASQLHMLPKRAPPHTHSHAPCCCVSAVHGPLRPGTFAILSILECDICVYLGVKIWEQAPPWPCADRTHTVCKLAPPEEAIAAHSSSALLLTVIFIDRSGRLSWRSLQRKPQAARLHNLPGWSSCRRALAQAQNFGAITARRKSKRSRQQRPHPSVWVIRMHLRQRRSQKCTSHPPELMSC